MLSGLYSNRLKRTASVIGVFLMMGCGFDAVLKSPGPAAVSFVFTDTVLTNGSSVPLVVGVIAGGVTQQHPNLIAFTYNPNVVGVSAGDDFVIDRAEIRAGETLWLAIGATGRDPRQFPEPNRLDIGRSPNRHLQFGIGPHFCIGAALARAEIQLALAGLLARFRRIELAADDIRWHEIAVFRGPKAVPLALGR